MTAIDRRSSLCAQTRLTGIDFLQVVDPSSQDLLRLFFVVDPSLLDTPMVAQASLQPAGTGVPATGLTVDIVWAEAEANGAAAIEVEGLDWRIVDTPSGPRLALEVSVNEPGGFEWYRLTLSGPGIDPFFGTTRFSFKQGCPQAFDCRTDCPPELDASVDVPVDYLARDFWSLRRALLDLLGRRYPQWSEPLVADQVVALTEIMAALGDEFAYTQDRYAAEATLPTATQRRSRWSLARLVDYTPDPGHAARTELIVWVDADGVVAPIGARVYARPEGRAAVAFAVEQQSSLDAAWNELDLYQPDSAVRCLPAGAREAYLVRPEPPAPELPPFELWPGRRAVLRSWPTDASEPRRAFGITIQEVNSLTDALTTPSTQLVRIRWAEPLPQPLVLEGAKAYLNVVPVSAGDQVVERFRIGPDAATELRFAALTFAERRDVLALPRAVEREGPWRQDRDETKVALSTSAHAEPQVKRGRILRYGLRRAETEGLGWTGQRDPLGIGDQGTRDPMLTLKEVLPPDFMEDPNGRTWQFEADILAADLDTDVFTLEPGTWRDVVTHRTPFEDVVFQDYASDAGWSLRFGEGAFGRPPADGTIFEVRFRTAPGPLANFGPDRITHLTVGDETPELSGAYAVTNPFAVTDGQAEADAETVRTDAPEAFRALPLRAVRPEDYARILERVDFVDRAHAVTRWTGSWSTDFVAAEPRGGFDPTSAQLGQTEAVVECVRQAGRDARVRRPDYLDVDLEIDVCVQRDAYPGEVIPRIERALTAPGFFSPDNFTFGQALQRSALEAAVQAVPGVKAVQAIHLRVRGKLDWRPFSTPELTAEPWQIIRVQNDPRFPGRGSVRISAHGGTV